MKIFPKFIMSKTTVTRIFQFLKIRCLLRVTDVTFRVQAGPSPRVRVLGNTDPVISRTTR